MAAKKGLRAVSPDEKAARKRASTVAEAVESGSRRDELVAMRTRIAKAIDAPDIRGADLAALSRRLLEVGKELAAVDAAVEQEAGESVEATDAPFNSSAI